MSARPRKPKRTTSATSPDFHPATGQMLSEVEGESPDLKKKPRQKTKNEKGKPTVTIAPGLRSTRDIFFNRPK